MLKYINDQISHFKNLRSSEMSALKHQAKLKEESKNYETISHVAEGLKLHHVLITVMERVREKVEKNFVCEKVEIE